MWIDRQPQHLSDEQLVDRYFAEGGSRRNCRDARGVDGPPDHLATCASCGQRYTAVARDLDVLTNEGVSEAEAVFTPAVLAQQRQEVMRRLESHGRRAHIFLFPARGARQIPGAARSWRPARWAAAAAAAGLAAGLGLGLLVDQVNVADRLPAPSSTVASRTLPGPVLSSPPETQIERSASNPMFGPMFSEENLLDEIDAALLTRRVQELRVYDELTPEHILISLRLR